MSFRSFILSLLCGLTATGSAFSMQARLSAYLESPQFREHAAKGVAVALGLHYVYQHPYATAGLVAAGSYLAERHLDANPALANNSVSWSRAHYVTKPIDWAERASGRLALSMAAKTQQKMTPALSWTKAKIKQGASLTASFAQEQALQGIDYMRNQALQDTTQTVTNCVQKVAQLGSSIQAKIAQGANPVLHNLSQIVMNTTQGLTQTTSALKAWVLQGLSCINNLYTQAIPDLYT